MAASFPPLPWRLRNSMPYLVVFMVAIVLGLIALAVL